jgi:hypothetical protein
MPQNAQKWLYVIFVILVPLAVVHAFPSAATRLVALLWVTSLLPVVFTVLLVASDQTVRLKTYSNPIVEKRLTLAAKALVLVLILLIVWTCTLPIWRGAIAVYVKRQPLTVINGKISDVSTTVLSPGIYWNLHIDQNSDGYPYLFPTVFSFPDKEYRVALLPTTSFVLDVQ